MRLHFIFRLAQSGQKQPTGEVRNKLSPFGETFCLFQDSWKEKKNSITVCLSPNVNLSHSR